MKANKIDNTLTKVIKTVIGVFLHLCSIVIWVPASIALGFSEVLGDVGETLTEFTEVEETDVVEGEVIEVEEIVTE